LPVDAARPTKIVDYRTQIVCVSFATISPTPTILDQFVVLPCLKRVQMVPITMHCLICPFALAFGLVALVPQVVLAEPPNGRREVISVELPDVPPIEPKFVAKLGRGPAKENSGIVKSRNYPDLFWMHNDSGDEPRIYPIHRDGTNYINERYPEEHGVLIGGAINVDWEDIACDADGMLIIADVGNNGNDRRDLTLYYVDEPAPTAGRTTFRKKVFVRFPDQQEFPASRDDFNYDCEAIFALGDIVYFLTKNRSNSHTSLYSLTDPKSEVVNSLAYLATFDLQGQAVAADCSTDGKRLAVLSYTGLWLFVRERVDQGFFTEEIWWTPLREHEAEAVCFANDGSLILADETTAKVYEVSTSELTKVQ
jgi:hypothetical protein